MLKISRMICLGWIILLSISVTAVASETSLIYYILDCSGSMWGRVDGKIKMQAAKEVMSTLIKETPNDIQGAVMVYGHRNKGDCADIEEIVPMGPLNKDEALAKIQKIHPKGKTPISDSISRAVDAIKGKGYASTLVLVSDGIETCDKDPCAVVKQLKESGIQFVMHVVGFDVKGEAAEQLACVAREGGGHYFSSSSAKDLLSALNRIKDSVVEKKAIEPQKTEKAPEPALITQQVSQKTTSIRIKAKGPGTISLKYDAWLKPPYYWKLVDSETGEEKARFRGLENQLVPPGEYQLVWRQAEHGSGEVTLGEVITVESGKTSEVLLKTGIRPVTPNWVKAPRFWGLQDPSTQKTVAHCVPLETQLVPSGEYDLIWRQDEHGSATLILLRVTIEPDKITEAPLTTAFNPVPTDWLPKDLRFWELQDTKTGKPAAHFQLGFGPQLVPPGTYRFIYRKDEHGSSNAYLGDVTVEEGKMNEFPLNTGIKLIPQAGMKPPYRIEFIEMDNKGKAVQTVFLNGSFDPMPLKPGRYKITYRQTEHGSATLTLVDSLDLPAGSLVEIEL